MIPVFAFMQAGYSVRQLSDLHLVAGVFDCPCTWLLGPGFHLFEDAVQVLSRSVCNQGIPPFLGANNNSERVLFYIFYTSLHLGVKLIVKLALRIRLIVIT